MSNKLSEAEIDLFSRFFHKFSHLVLHKSSKPWNELFLIIEIFYYLKRSSVAVARSFYAKYVTNTEKQIALMTKNLMKNFFLGKNCEIGGPQRQNSGCFQRDTDRFGPVTSRRECFPYQFLLIQEKEGNSIELFVKKGKS